MKCTKIILMGCFFVSSAVLMAPPKEDKVLLLQRVAAYNQEYQKAEQEYKQEINRVLQTREEDGIIAAEDMFKVCKQELAEQFPDVIRYLQRKQ